MNPTFRRCSPCPFFFATLPLALAVYAAPLQAEHPISFEVHALTVDANEGCDIADVDGDGKLDVIAGRNWYRNGDWLPRPVRQIEDANGYVASNGDFAYDVNGDGRVDVIAGQFFQGQVYWYENPGPQKLMQGYLWSKHLLQDTGQSTNEASYLRDLTGDGKPEWITNQWNKNSPLIVWSLGTEAREVAGGKKNAKGTREVPALSPHIIGQSNGHGIGFGDINNDGREDILVATGWYEAPDSDLFAATWTFHPDWDTRFSCPVLIRDIDGDGVNDVLWGNPHGFGVYAWIGKGAGEDGKLQFEEIEIDKSYSQPHCLHFADLDGDGKDELITGKRVRAHNGKDPGGGEPPLVCYYTYDAGAKSFERHNINRGQVGIGLQIRTADLDSDGDTDIVLAGKEGTQILFNRRK